MIMRMFALKDVKMGLFMAPMYFNSQGEALRVISDEVNRQVQGAEPATTLQLHPEDVEFYEIGEFERESGKLHTAGPKFICSCKDLAIGRS